jgi:hypothetical protein
VIDQALWGFAHAPSSSKQPIHIRAQHRTGMIQGEQGVKPQFFELALPGDAAPAALGCDVNGLRVVPF